MRISRSETVVDALRKNYELYSSEPCLSIDQHIWTYGDLHDFVCKAAGPMSRHGKGPFVAILGNKSLSAYAAIHAILNAGKAYLPINPGEPAERALAMLAGAGCDQIVCAPESEKLAREILARSTVQLTVYFLETNHELQQYPIDFPGHRYIDCTLAGSPQTALPPPPESSSPAYLIHTSGSTGRPKAVLISHSNLSAYIANINSQYPITHIDRVSQAPDISFDLSVHDLFYAWSNGACLVSISEHETFAPARTISRDLITVWTSVPSVVRFMARLGLLKPDAFPSIRLSFFCGEPFTFDDAQAWKKAAPGSRIINMYGPTEATVAVSAHEVEFETDVEAPTGIVPLGRLFSDQRAAIISDHGASFGDERSGELYLQGSQVFGGYYGDPNNSIKHLTKIPGEQGIWYRTGDIVVQNESEILYYRGRSDFQVKLNGYRIELAALESEISSVTAGPSVVLVKGQEPATRRLVAFIVGDADSDLAARTRKHLEKTLPAHMIPARFIHLEAFPLNKNGKIDRRRLELELD